MSQRVDSSEMAMAALPENTLQATVLVVDNETNIVDSLVYAHGGKVTVTTAPGRGCRFTVHLTRIADVPAGLR
jgi:hypothetical protein